MGRNRLSDPAWKSGPSYPEPTSSEHAIQEPVGEGDWDGVGRDEAERLDGEPLLAIQEHYPCHREACDESMKRRILFSTDSVSAEDLSFLADIADGDELASIVWELGERVDEDTIDVMGVFITAERIETEEPHGSCYGHVEPEPDIDAHRYDL